MLLREILMKPSNYRAEAINIFLSALVDETKKQDLTEEFFFSS